MLREKSMLLLQDNMSKLIKMQSLFDFKKRVLVMLMLGVVVYASLPNVALAQIVPCGNMKDESGRVVDECSFYDLIKLAKNLIDTLIKISFPVAAAMIAWAGIIMMLNPANSGKRTEALGMMKNVVIGFAIIISAWLVVGAIAKVLINENVVNMDDLIKF